MRVLLWTEQFWPYLGGLEVMTTRYALALRTRGYDVAVVTSHGHRDLPDDDTHEGIPVHRFRFYEALANRDIELLFETRRRVSQLKKRLQPDVVHITTISPCVFFYAQTAAIAPCPLVVTQQLATLPGQATGQDTVLRQVLQQARRVTCCSRSLLEETCRLAPEVTDRASVIFNGVDAPEVAPAARPEPPRLLCLGRLVPEKGFDVALQAMPEILRAVPNAALTIAGDGPARAELEALAQELGVEDAVTFRGWITPEHVPQLMNDSTLVLVPSRAEAFGLVAAEAALMERPVIASRVGGLPEVVEDGCTGDLVDAEDERALAARTIALLEDPDRQRSYGVAARERAATRFSWDAYMDAYESIYRHCTNEVTSHDAAS